MMPSRHVEVLTLNADELAAIVAVLPDGELRERMRRAWADAMDVETDYPFEEQEH